MNNTVSGFSALLMFSLVAANSVLFSDIGMVFISIGVKFGCLMEYTKLMFHQEGLTNLILRL